MNLFADFFKCNFSIKIPGTLQKMFVNNETLQKPKTEQDYLFSIEIQFALLPYEYAP